MRFLNSKILGVDFGDCHDFLLEMYFENCDLTLSSFYGLTLKNRRFVSCKLQEVDFTNADLSASVFDNCDLHKALFENTNLEKADFRTARHYSIDPELNRIKKAKFSIPDVVGLLDRYDLSIQ